MDNAGSFDVLGHALASTGTEIVAIDLPGHGQSSHRPYAIPFGYDWYNYTVATAAALDQLGWRRFNLVGHSMGAGIAAMVAGIVCIPSADVEAACSATDIPQNPKNNERPVLEKLVFIEGLGPISRPTSRSCATLARHVQVASTLLSKRRKRGSRVYESIQEAVDARIRTVERHPGNQSISAEAAKMIVNRGVLAQGGGFVFTHDIGILPTQAVYADEEAVESYLKAISGAKVPTLLLTAERGWPFPKESISARMALLEGLESHCIANCSHHLHADPGSADAVAKHIERFFGAGC
jgi:pimeloyl-ACP methyl ester carboxylesterase